MLFRKRDSRRRRFLRSSSPISGLRLLCALAWSLQPVGRLAPRARFVLSDETSAPGTFGIRHATILLPAAFAAMDRERQSAIAAHELLHARRHDWLFLVLEELLKAVLFFHPAVHWLVGRIRLAREQAVDAAVVRRLGGRIFAAFRKAVVRHSQQRLRRELRQT